MTVNNGSLVPPHTAPRSLAKRCWANKPDALGWLFQGQVSAGQTVGGEENTKSAVVPGGCGGAAERAPGLQPAGPARPCPAPQSRLGALEELPHGAEGQGVYLIPHAGMCDTKLFTSL